jgi:hypothetical protein
MLHSPGFDNTSLGPFEAGAVDVVGGEVEQEIAASAQNEARTRRRM